MPCRLVDLSPELQLKIVEELLKDTQVDNGKDSKSSSEEDQYSCSQEKPGEKQEWKKREEEQDRGRDLMNWSCTSLFFRDLLAPYIFKSVKLCNSDKSGSSAATLSNSKHGKHVKQLHFTGSAPGNAHRDEKEYSDTAAILPGSVSTLLSDLRCFPSLETLSIGFDYRFYDYKEWDGGLDLCAEEETEEDVKSAEEQIAWRALMAKTYQALIQNRDIHFKNLEIRQLGPKKISIFTSPGFHTLLGRLKRFSLSIYGEDNGAGWKVIMYPDYQVFMSNLDAYFFNHLTSVSELTLKAPEEGPLGLHGMNHIPLTLKKGQMASLKTLYLEYIFIGSELVDFLIDHNKTLEHLCMRKCSASVIGLAEDGIHWNKFFDSLHDASFESLREVVILFDRVPLTYEECYGKDEDKAKVPAEVKEARRIIKDDPSRRLFPYTHLDDKYGMLFENEEDNLAAFGRGDDQASYERFMSRVKANVAKDGQELD